MNCKELKFRNLRPDEIDIRSAGGTKMLLYKDARVDQNILDETVGTLGWKKEYKRINDALYCILSIRDPETGEWISKEDAGVPSRTEEVKGEASDAFKRAAFCFGIGRSLYSTPNIDIPRSLQIGKLSVKEIGYDENGKINLLKIVNGVGQIVYTYPQVEMSESKKITENEIKKMTDEIRRTGSSMEGLLKHFKIKKVEDMTVRDFVYAMNRLSNCKTVEE